MSQKNGHFWEEKKTFTCYSHKTSKNDKVLFSIKLILTAFLQHQNTHKSKNLYKIGKVRKWPKINFLEKINSKDQKNLFFAITFESLDQTFSKSGI